MVNDKRNVGILILFSFLTCGIYNFFFTYDFVNDMNRVCNGDGETTPGLLKLVLLSICTCGIYGIYWRYKVAVRQQAKAERYGIHMPAGGGAVVAWTLLGLFWISWYILINNMNMLAYEYNKQFRRNTPIQQPQRIPQQPQPQPLPTPQPSPANGSKTVPIDVANRGITLYCTAGEFKGNEFPLKEGDIIAMGRDQSCNIKFRGDTQTVSRKHCTVTVENGNVYVTDNNSSFGTFLENGSRIAAGNKTIIHKGSGFFLGSRVVSFKVK